VTEEMHGWYRDPDVDFAEPVDAPGRFDAGTHQEIRRNYAAMIENIDRWVGRFRDRLAERGDLADTVIVFAADHGEMLGDHDRWGKGVPYRASTGVPFVVAGAGVESRDPVETPVSLLDLHATALDDAGLSAESDGHSLAPVLRGGDFDRPPVTSGLDDWRLATDGRFSLVSGFDFGDDLAGETSDPVLFDRDAEPGETQSVAEAHPDVVEELLAVLPD
jgi:arylsulfatase A-like enzyme